MKKVFDVSSNIALHVLEIWCWPFWHFGQTRVWGDVLSTWGFHDNPGTDMRLQLFRQEPWRSRLLWWIHQYHQSKWRLEYSPWCILKFRILIVTFYSKIWMRRDSPLWSTPGNLLMRAALARSPGESSRLPIELMSTQELRPEKRTPR
jgi:hypothetical protein